MYRRGKFQIILRTTDAKDGDQRWADIKKGNYRVDN